MHTRRGALFSDVVTLLAVFVWASELEHWLGMCIRNAQPQTSQIQATRSMLEAMTAYTCAALAAYAHEDTPALSRRRAGGRDRRGVKHAPARAIFVIDAVHCAPHIPSGHDDQSQGLLLPILAP